MQFDVFANPDARFRLAFPLAAILHSNYADTRADAVVAFLAPRSGYPKAPGRLTPTVRVKSNDYFVLLTSITYIPKRELRRANASVADYRDQIVAALDCLFTGF